MEWPSKLHRQVSIRNDATTKNTATAIGILDWRRADLTHSEGRYAASIRSWMKGKRDARSSDFVQSSI